MLHDARIGLTFPEVASQPAGKAVERFSTQLDDVRTLATRLTLRLGDAAPAVEAFSKALEHLSSVATIMGFGADGVIAPGGDDLESTIEEFFLALSAKRRFFVEARRLLN